MFGSSNKDANKIDPSKDNKNTPPSRGLNTVNEGTTVTGDLKAESDIRVDGTIKGNLDCEAKVIIGPKGMIEGEVKCESAVIEGEFHGKLFVKDMLTVKETAKITGDVVTRKVAMMAGCDFEGTVTTRGTAPVKVNDKVAALKQKESV